MTNILKVLIRSSSTTLLSIFILALAGCGGGSSNSDANRVSISGAEDTFSGIVGTAGGTLQTASKSIILEFPSGALTSNVNVTAKPPDPSLIPPGAVGSSVIELGPTGQSFSTGVSLSMKYDVADLPPQSSEQGLSIAVLDGENWILIPTTVNISNKTLTATLKHFSIYSIQLDSTSKQPHGTALGDFNGTTIYSNGCFDPTTAACGGHPDKYNLANVDNYNTGLEWQCVELVNRFFFNTYKERIRIEGRNANDYYKNSIDRDLISYPNESAQAPQACDIIVSEGGKYGHVAVIREVTDTSVIVAQQNWHQSLADTSTSLSLTKIDGKYKVGAFSTSYPVTGWVKSTKQILQAGISSVFPLSGKVRLEWGENSEYTYNLYYAAAGDVSPTNFSTRPKGKKISNVSSPLTVSGLENDIEYTFVLVAERGQCISAPSTPVTLTPKSMGEQWNRVFATSRDLGSVYVGEDKMYLTGFGTLYESKDGRIFNFALSGSTPFTNERDNQFGSSGATSITSGNGRVVAVGHGGTILSGTSISALRLESAGTGRKLNSVAFGSGRFVAVGTEGVATVSTDGVAWTAVKVGANTLTNVAYLAGKFYAVGLEGIVRSNDGLRWDLVYKGSDRVPLTSISYGSGRFVAVGWGVILTSVDGQTWAVDSSLGKIFVTSQFGNGHFVIASYHGDVYVSQNGLQWKIAGLMSDPDCPTCTNLISGGVFFNGSFYLKGSGGYTGGAWHTSRDGSVWSRDEIFGEFATPKLRGITLLNDRYISWGFDGLLIYSDDAISWFRSTLPREESLERVVVGKGAAVGVTALGNIFQSSNGSDWREVSSLRMRSSDTLIFGAGKFISYGLNGHHYWSADGRVWTEFEVLDFGPGIYSATSDGKVILVPGNGEIWLSTDGVKFTSVLKGLQSISIMQHGNGFFTIFDSQAATVYTSIDGKAWSKRVLYSNPVQVFGGFGADHQVAYLQVLPTNAQFGGEVWISSNGQNWERWNNEFRRFANSVVGKNSIAAIDFDGGLLYSR